MEKLAVEFLTECVEYVGCRFECPYCGHDNINGPNDLTCTSCGKEAKTDEEKYV